MTPTWVGEAIALFPLGFGFLALLIASVAFFAGVFIERMRSEHLIAEITRLRRTLMRSSRSGW